MTERIDVDTLTPDDHVATLHEAAASFQAMAEWLNKPGPCPSGNLHLKRAAAIRWLMSETAHGCTTAEAAD